MFLNQYAVNFSGPTTYPNCCLLVMAKSPELGRVKTRLQPYFSKQFSRNLHLHLLDYCLSQWHSAAVCPIRLYLAGDENTFFDHLPHYKALDWHQQMGKDLGERMLYAANETLSTEKKVVLVGTDCPFIDKHYLLNACEALNTTEVVIGPAADGGYVLLGLTCVYASLFENITWGADSVFEDTLATLKKIQCTYQILPTLEDIDRPEDIDLLKEIPFFNDLQS